MMREWTKEHEIALINEKQSYYVEQLSKLLQDDISKTIKTVNFSSSTGTGKTKMMAMLFDNFPDKFFIVTTLSRGQLQRQIRTNIEKFCQSKNFIVYGLQDYTANTKRTADDIINLLPCDIDIVWVRDEGHINTNKWQEILKSRVKNIINFSATNKDKHGIICNFTETAMLRTVSQNIGKPEDAIQKLIEIKKQHKIVKNYNPCALFRVIDDKQAIEVIDICKKYNLEYINITVENFDMQDICRDDNKYDVIINKFKIIEGTDLKRAHVLYMDNKPNNVATTIQVIGRCRRNALLWRDDIDIFELDNKTLLEHTRKCYVFYKKENTNVEDKNGELLYELCDRISVQELSIGSKIHVEDGILANGLMILELEGETGDFVVKEDEKTGFNYVDNESFYRDIVVKEEFDSIETIDWENSNDDYSSDDVEYDNYYGVSVAKKRKVSKDTIRQYWKYVDKEKVWDRNYFEQIEKDIDNPYYLEDYYTGKTIKIKVLYSDIHEELDKYVKIATYGGLHWGLKMNFMPYDKIKEKLDKSKHIVLGMSKKELQWVLKSQPRSGNVFTKIGWMKVEPLWNGQKLSYWQKAIEGQNLPINKGKEYFEDEFPEHIVSNNKVLKSRLEYVPLYKNYSKKINNFEIALVGPEKFRFIEKSWVEDTSVGSKVGVFCKFNTFITDKYQKQLASVDIKSINAKFESEFDKKSMMSIGFCVEYYTKYLMYGSRYFDDNIIKAQQEYARFMTKQLDEKDVYSRYSKERLSRIEEYKNEINDYILVRACYYCYKDNMIRVYNRGISRLIPTISIEKLMDEKHSIFVSKVVELANKTFEFLKTEIDVPEKFDDNMSIHDANLSVNHISALADFVFKDKIIDIKCTGNVDIRHIKQMLAYHYLSQFRDDLNIKQLVLYDVIADKCIKINV